MGKRRETHMATDKKLPPSRAWAAKLIHAALSILRDNGKEMPMRDLMAKVEKQVSLDAWAKERYERTAYVRWESILHFFSIDCVKAGYLIKKKGVWYLTPEGEDALKLSPEKLLEGAQKAYRKWRAEQPERPETEGVGEVAEQAVAYEEVEQKAIEGLEQYLRAKNPYEFQDLVAALLRAMGYYTPFVSPKGKDGGVDIVAYRDPLGTQEPRIQVQIKHRDAPTPAQDVRQLMGLLQKEGDVGIFVSSGGFSSEARGAARSSHIHVELIDLNRFIGLWQEFYDKLSDEDKRLLPLRPIYFLGAVE
jgi:restriction system protein